MPSRPHTCSSMNRWEHVLSLSRQHPHARALSLFLFLQVVEHYGFNGACLVAHSYGSAVASWLIQFAPHLVKGVVLLDPAVSWEKKRERESARDGQRKREFVAHSVRAAPCQGCCAFGSCRVRERTSKRSSVQETEKETESSWLIQFVPYLVKGIVLLDHAVRELGFRV